MKVFQDKYKWGRFLVILFSILAMCVVGAYFVYDQYAKVVEKERETVLKVSKQLDVYFNSRLLALQFLAADVEVKSLEPIEVENELKRPVELFGFCNVAVYDTNGGLVAEAKNICPDKSVHSSEYFNQVLNGNNIISNSISCKIAKYDYISMSVPVYNDDKIVGVLAAGILVNDLAKLVSNEELSDMQYLFIRDGNKKLVYHQYAQHEEKRNIIARDAALDFTKQFTDDYSFHNEGMMYIHTNIENTNWDIVLAVPLSWLYSKVFVACLYKISYFIVIILCIWILYRNLAKMKELEENMRRIRMERLDSVNWLAAGLTHEIRNPLTSIKGFVQLMSLKKDKPLEQDYIQVILDEIERIDKLVGEFQYLARPLKKTNLIKVNMAKITNDVIVLMEGPAKKQGIDIVLTNNPTPDVLGDEAQLKQVMLNLVKNAIDAVGKAGKIDITILSRENKVIVKVQDNGPGMTKDVLDKIGTPFFTTKAEGNGLGLSVCYDIINRHGGHIDVESLYGKGTTFTISLLVVK